MSGTLTTVKENIVQRMSWAEPKKYHFSTGFYKHRRREQAILVHNVLMWKPGALGISHLNTFFDMASAFPSLTREVIDWEVDEIMQEDDAKPMNSRHRMAVVEVSNVSGESLALKPGTGGMQGDGPMAGEFSSVCGPRVEQQTGLRREKLGRGFVTADPLTG